MARHSGVTFKSKNHYSNELQKSNLLRDQFYRRGRRRSTRRPLSTASGSTDEGVFQTREAAQKAGMALKRAFPILHVGVLDVE